jgi:hypothetical protein
LTCREVVELATDHFEAALAARDSERFAAHVAGCPGCQAYLRQLRITVDVVHTAADHAPFDTDGLRWAFGAWRGGGNPDPS